MKRRISVKEDYGEYVKEVRAIKKWDIETERYVFGVLEELKNIKSDYFYSFSDLGDFDGDLKGDSYIKSLKIKSVEEMQELFIRIDNVLRDGENYIEEYIGDIKEDVLVKYRSAEVDYIKFRNHLEMVWDTFEDGVINEKINRGLMRNLSNLIKRYSEVFASEAFRTNLDLAEIMIRRFRRFNSDMFDLSQEANMGLAYAVENYDFKRGIRFRTFAQHYVKRQITRYFVKSSKDLKYSSHFKGSLRKYKQTIAILKEKKGDDGFDYIPTHKEIADFSGMSLAIIEGIEKAIGIRVVELDNIKGGGVQEGPLNLHEIVSNAEEELVCEKVIKTDVRRKLNQLLDLIPEFEKMILKKRFGLEEGNYGNDAKAKDIGEELGFSRQRVQQYEVRAMDRLKKEIKKSGYNLN